MLSVSCGTLEAQTGSPVALERARILITGSEYGKAAAVLEEGLETASPSEKPALVGLLRQSYRSLIDQAEAAGKSRQAAEYRENLAILDQVPMTSEGKPRRKPRTASARGSPAGWFVGRFAAGTVAGTIRSRAIAPIIDQSRSGALQRAAAQAGSERSPALEGPGSSETETTRPGTPRGAGASEHAGAW